MNRLTVIQDLIDRHGYTKYLEIGTQGGAVFSKVRCAQKVGVDPDPKAVATHHMTSDQFFKEHPDHGDRNTLVFIDGMHECRQAYRDFLNSVEAGHVVFHDCMPPDEPAQRVPRETKVWTGDVWKCWHYLSSMMPGIKLYEFDFGVGVVSCYDIALQQTFVDFLESRTGEGHKVCLPAELPQEWVDRPFSWLEENGKPHGPPVQKHVAWHSQQAHG